MRAVFVGMVVSAVSVGGWADDLDHASVYRSRVNAAIDVLVASKATPSTACLSALNDMHTTEAQLKELTGQADEGGSPQVIASQSNEIGIARDVLASDLQTAATACFKDAARACAAGTPAAQAACGTLQRFERPR